MRASAWRTDITPPSAKVRRVDDAFARPHIPPHARILTIGRPCVADRPCSAALGRDLSERGAPIRGPTHVHQDGVAPVGRHAIGVEYVPSLLSGGALGGLSLCPRVVAMAASGTSGVAPRDHARGLAALSSAGHAERRGRATGKLDCCGRVAAAAADGDAGVSLHAAGSGGADGAALVRLYQTRRGVQPLLPLCGEQSGFLRRPHRVSDPHRAAASPE